MCLKNGPGSNRQEKRIILKLKALTEIEDKTILRSTKLINGCKSVPSSSHSPVPPGPPRRHRHYMIKEFVEFNYTIFMTFDSGFKVHRDIMITSSAVAKYIHEFTSIIFVVLNSVRMWVST